MVKSWAIGLLEIGISDTHGWELVLAAAAIYWAKQNVEEWTR